MSASNTPPQPDNPPGPPRRAPGERDHPTETRASRGRYTGNITADEKAANAARILANNPGMTYQQLADAAGYSNRGDAWRAVQKCRQAVLQSAGIELIKTESQQLDDLYVMALEIIERNHVTVSHGKVVTMLNPETGKEEPILDDGPRLQAIQTALRIRDQFENLHGLKQPTQVAVSGAVRYEVVGVDPADLT